MFREKEQDDSILCESILELIRQVFPRNRTGVSCFVCSCFSYE